MLRKAIKRESCKSKSVLAMTEFKDPDDMLQHFKEKFTEGMTVGNHGRGND